MSSVEPVTESVIRELGRAPVDLPGLGIEGISPFLTEMDWVDLVLGLTRIHLLDPYSSKAIPYLGIGPIICLIENFSKWITTVISQPTIPISEQLNNQGYAFIRSYCPDSTTMEAISMVGQVDIVEGLNEIQTLLPRSPDEATPNTYSGNFGLNEFPLHTDLAHWAIPPRYLALRCLTGDESVSTRLLDGQLLLDKFTTEVLRTILVQSRRSMGNGKQLLQVLDRVESSAQFRIRWDSLFLLPATDYSKMLFRQINEFVSQCLTSNIILLNRGDTLLVDNWRMLHGRTAAPRNTVARHIERAYLRSIS